MDKISLDDWKVGTLFKTKNGLVLQMIAVETPFGRMHPFKYVMKEIDMVDVVEPSERGTAWMYTSEGAETQTAPYARHDEYAIIDVLYGKKRDIPRGMSDYSKVGAGSLLLTDSNIMVVLVDKIHPARKEDDVILHVRPVGKIMSDKTVGAIQACSQQTYAVSKTGLVHPESDMEKKHFIVRVLFDTMTLSKETASSPGMGSSLENMTIL